MKRPDEIKKGLECCARVGHCYECPYNAECLHSVDDANPMHMDALAYIQQLEAERDALATALQRCDSVCDYCKHSAIPNPSCEAMNMDCMSCDADCPCKSCLDNSNWQWRGVQMGIPMLDKKTVSQCISADYCTAEGVINDGST